jgi:hypothetical protein
MRPGQRGLRLRCGAVDLVQNLPYVQDGEGKNEQHRVAQFWQDRAPCGDTVIRDAVSAGDPDALTAQASLLAVGLMR